MVRLRRRNDVKVKGLPFAAHTSRINFELFDEDDNVVFRIKKQPVGKAKKVVEEVLGFKL